MKQNSEKEDEKMEKHATTCTEVCGHCDGTGFVPNPEATPEEWACAGGMCGVGTEEICPECKGKGRVVRKPASTPRPAKAMKSTGRSS